MPNIEARITKVEQDAGTGWYRISTDHPDVSRLDTKIPEKAREAGALKEQGAVALIDYTEKPGNINQNTGQRYMNRYYEKAGPLATPEVATGIDVVQPTGRKTDPQDAWRMSLAKAGELAVSTLPLMPEEQRSFEVQKQIALAWARFFYYTPPPRPELPENVSEMRPSDDFPREWGSEERPPADPSQAGYWG